MSAPNHNHSNSVEKDHKDSKEVSVHQVSSSSSSSSGAQSGTESFPEVVAYNEQVPISHVADDAISRELSRIKSYASAATQGRPNEEDIGTGAEKESDAQSVYSISKDPKFDRFSSKKKGFFVFIVSAACFLSPLSGLAFLPAVPEIAERFNTTGEVINISAAVYCVFMSLSPCIFSPISDIYGRRFCFISCCIAYCVCTVLVAVSVNLAMFYIFRALTALFATAFFSVGAHIIGDCYIPSERGRQMSWIVTGAQTGTSIGGVIGGIIVNWTSWRVIFWVMAGLGGVILALGIFLLPETSYKTKHSILLEEARKVEPNKKFVFVWFNPLRIVGALKYPTLSLDGFIVIAMVYNMYSLLTPIRYVLNPRFDLESPLYSGLFYLAPGVGYLIGSFFGGRLADSTVKKWIKKRGRRVPEDRLRQMVMSLTFYYPGCILIYGWTVDKAVGGMAVPIIFMFLSGLAQTIAFPASNTYCVDSVPELHGDGVASSYFSRYLAAAVASGTCLRSIENIGVGWTCTISAFVLFAASGCNFILIFYGETMRMKSLVKYGHRTQEELDKVIELQKDEPKW
ncbi:uncharacterized protein CXQ87_003000 [Candidozyma duobushaemuli]|uniref:Major facilitator superfamily (MFS) profile domain-containing protein n=2 Tax=Candidozyma TaxID=3303203 RepID=A0ABX8I547_9ASCO|nr:uncharacterized protein CXQ87_003000 [[Candida] duobushaemulonis]PVH15163.1 hypothetical protein CXQ87_003000 [[Candida] duobushaemulonis]QWU88416.1 hypothetical protein CA3LBN_002724 [[Candida] haemuloni]